MEAYISLVTTLLSADSSGLIKIPRGSASEIDDITSHLMTLETLGFLTRVEGTAYYRPFLLTKSGAKLKSVLEKAEAPAVKHAAETVDISWLSSV